MPDIAFKGVPAKEAIEHIRQKIDIPTERWDQLIGPVQGKAFTVSGVTKMQLLGEFHQAIQDALDNGETIAQFREKFDQSVKRHGWSYNGNRGWRTRVIYDTNLRTAHMAGRWKQIEQNKQRRPYLIYYTVGDEAVRDQHRAWQSIALPVDDPWWNTHYPPNGWGCRCYVITANQRQLEKLGLSVSESPNIDPKPRENSRTGEVYGDVPDGIDTGWDYNVGKAWIGPDLAWGQELMKLPDNLKEVAYESISKGNQVRTAGWKTWLKEVDQAPHPRGLAQTVGFLSPSTITALEAKQIIPNNAAIVIYDNQLNHLRGDHKKVDKTGQPKAFPEAWLQDLPERLKDYQAVLRHKKTGNIVFVLKEVVGSKQGRAVVAVNFKHKKSIINSIRSLGVVDVRDLGKDYEVLEGALK